MSKRQELIDHILAMTPEQLQKLFAHPEFIRIMNEEKESKNQAASKLSNHLQANGTFQ